MTDMDDLIARLEAALEGNRHHDFRVARAVDPANEDHWEGQWKRVYVTKDDDINEIGLPHYTTSLDAALPGEKIYMVERLASDRWRAWHPRGTNDLRPQIVIATAATEPLARRIAALKARA